MVELLLLVDLEVPMVVVEEDLLEIMVETHQTLKLDQLVDLVEHKVVVEVLVRVLELLQLLDLHCRVVLADKVQVLFPTGLLAVEAVEVFLEVAAVVVVTMMDLDLVQHLVVGVDLVE